MTAPSRVLVVLISGLLFATCDARCEDAGTASPPVLDTVNSGPPIRLHLPKGNIELDGGVAAKYRNVRPGEYPYMLIVGRRFGVTKVKFFMNEYFASRAMCDHDRTFARNIDSKNVLLAACVKRSASSDYHGKVDRWEIKGSAFTGGVACSATVHTKIGSVTVSRIEFNNNSDTIIAIAGASDLAPQSQAEQILRSQQLLHNGQSVAEIGGSEDVLMEFNRCIESENMGSDGE